MLQDARHGYVSLENAREIYGVAIDPQTWTIDEAETTRLRGGAK